MLSPSAFEPACEPTPRWWSPLRALFIVLTLLPWFLVLTPVLLGYPKYTVQGGQITARSVTTSTVIPAETPVEAVTLHRLSREVGSEISGYMVGIFSSDRGTLNVYGNGSRTGLLFQTTPRATFLTPADPQALLQAWRGGSATATEEPLTFKPAPKPLWTLENLWPLLIMLPVVGMTYAMFIRTPRISYHMNGEALEVKTLLRTLRFPRYGTQAELTSEALGTRLMGSAMPNYYTGTFAIRSGNVQAAATQSRPVQALLLHQNGRRYYLTPSDPEAVAQWFKRT